MGTLVCNCEAMMQQHFGPDENTTGLLQQTRVDLLQLTRWKIVVYTHWTTATQLTVFVPFCLASFLSILVFVTWSASLSPKAHKHNARCISEPWPVTALALKCVCMRVYMAAQMWTTLFRWSTFVLTCLPWFSFLISTVHKRNRRQRSTRPEACKDYKDVLSVWARKAAYSTCV